MIRTGFELQKATFDRAGRPPWFRTGSRSSNTTTARVFAVLCREPVANTTVRHRHVEQPSRCAPDGTGKHARMMPSRSTFLRGPSSGASPTGLLGPRAEACRAHPPPPVRNIRPCVVAAVAAASPRREHGYLPSEMVSSPKIRVGRPHARTRRFLAPCSCSGIWSSSCAGQRCSTPGSP